MAPSPTSLSTPVVKLAPSYNLPLALVGLAIPTVFFLPWVGLAIALFGLFLLYQTVSLQVYFTPTELDIYRGDTLLRRFPYSDWSNWRIFWQPVPILFYFREVKSIHFLPILFDPKMLQVCLESRIPQKS